MLDQLGTHRGKQIVFGYDRHGLAELDAYTAAFSAYGIPVPAVVTDKLHYLTSAERTCQRVAGRVDRVGILMCSTGVGMSIAANKFRGIYAARCLTVEDAELAREINNSNLLCLAIRTGFEVNQQIVHAFLTTPYQGRKLDQLSYLEDLEMKATEAALAVSPPPKKRQFA